MHSHSIDQWQHSHVFLGEDHDRHESRTWMVIWLCSFMMLAEIGGGLLFGSIALVADGLHMSTHAGALLLAALAYTYARKHADDSRFTFGTGKLGDLAGFTSAIILAMIAMLIAYEAIARLFSPVPISFNEVIPIAFAGLAVNVASAWLLGGTDHYHGDGHHAHDDDHDLSSRRISASGDILTLTIFEEGVPPRFRLSAESGASMSSADTIIETVRLDGARQVFKMVERDGNLESLDEIPEPHAFVAWVAMGQGDNRKEYPVAFEEHEHNRATHRDNNMRAAIIHVIADAAVSVLVITGLLFARFKGWLWMDPMAGIVGSLVIASWSYGLIRDTGAILLDINPDRGMTQRIRTTIEADGDRLADLHLWRLGPGHLGAILSVTTTKRRDPKYYRRLLDRFRNLSHVTVEVLQAEIPTYPMSAAGSL
jgi:cation diffusion facilitator family transporter